MRALPLILLAAAAAPVAAQPLLIALSGTTTPILHRINGATGAIFDSLPITGHQSLTGGLAYTHSGSVFTLDSKPIRLFRINSLTGAGAVIGPVGFNWTTRCIASNGNEVNVIGDNTLYLLNLSTGQATVRAVISGPAQLDQVTAMATFVFSGPTYITDANDTDLFTLNLQTGVATWVGAVGGSGDPFKDLETSGTTLRGIRASGGIYQIDRTTAAQTLQFPGVYTGLDSVRDGAPFCYPNCDGSTVNPVLTANDFMCYINRWANGDSYANCDSVGGLTAGDMVCFMSTYAAGCH